MMCITMHSAFHLNISVQPGLLLSNFYVNMDNMI